jgi:hypothetical protein
MGELHDILTGEIIDAPKTNKSKFRFIGRRATKSNLVVVKNSEISERNVAEAVRLGVAVSEAIMNFNDQNSEITELEVEDIVREHSALMDKLSPADLDSALEQINQILMDKEGKK